ncbi:hypothetical protein [Paludisphaera sp.]|uniref:hypothetical protein n=1 Tax=Paludisphaera sp. TaxID=2017432 RepID=UPI00301E5F65
MARKRATPKPPADVPAVPSAGGIPDALPGEVAGLASLIGSIRTRRVVLLRSHVVADPDAPAFGVAGTVGLEPPESVHDFDPRTGVLRVVCHCRLSASGAPTKGKGKGRKEEAGAPLLIVEATFLLEFDVAPEVVARIDDALLDVFSGVAVSQAWPYWREFVRDASTRAGLPVIDVPFEVEF